MNVFSSPAALRTHCSIDLGLSLLNTHSLTSRYTSTVAEQTYVCTFQYWCNQISAWPYSTSVTRPKSLRLLYRRSLPFFSFVLVSGSSGKIFFFSCTFSRFSLVVIDLHQHNITPPSSDSFSSSSSSSSLERLVFLSLRTTKHHSLVINKRQHRPRRGSSLSQNYSKIQLNWWLNDC